MKYIVYQTTNLVNSKIYIGVHKTENPDVWDGYLGGGCFLSRPSTYSEPETPFQYAVKKYGPTNFKRVILKIFDVENDAYELEGVLVNSDFIKREDTYNIALGGNKGNYLFPVNQFDKNGKLIKKWDNMALASEALGVSRAAINSAKIGKKSCLGYLWSSEESIDPKEFSWKERTKTYKYTLDGYLVDVFESMTKACKDAGVQEKTMYRNITCDFKTGDYYYSFKLVDKFTPRKLDLKGKYIYIYDLGGNYIGQFTLSEAREYYNIKSSANIKEAILQGRVYKDTQISLEKVDKMSPKEKKEKSRKVGCYTLEGEFIEEFDSVRAAVRKYGQGVSKVLGGTQNKCKNLKFKYL